MIQIHSFIYSNHFILIRVRMHPEPIPGTLAIRREYRLDHRALCTHTYSLTHKGNLHLLAWFLFFFSEKGRSQTSQRKPTKGKHSELHTGSNPISGLNRGPWSCKAAALPVCYLDFRDNFTNTSD